MRAGTTKEETHQKQHRGRRSSPKRKRGARQAATTLVKTKSVATWSTPFSGVRTLWLCARNVLRVRAEFPSFARSVEKEHRLCERVCVGVLDLATCFVCLEQVNWAAKGAFAASARVFGLVLFPPFLVCIGC